ncbi:MAG: hypothetical protein FWD58_00790 [Firmicutes bacterium]|nr:hypothetical protein [Bacillota bacterium]
MDNKKEKGRFTKTMVGLLRVYLVVITVPLCIYPVIFGPFGGLIIWGLFFAPLVPIIVENIKMFIDTIRKKDFYRMNKNALAIIKFTYTLAAFSWLLFATIKSSLGLVVIVCSIVAIVLSALLFCFELIHEWIIK